MTSEICSRVNPRRGADSTSIEEEGEPVLDSTNAPDIAVVFWELLWVCGDSMRRRGYLPIRKSRSSFCPFFFFFGGDKLLISAD
jgi:hypothetical protein